MMMKRNRLLTGTTWRILLLLVFSSIILTSCFIEDIPVPPHQPGEAIQVQLEESMYTNQVYFDFSRDSVVFVCPNNYYQLAFESWSSGWRIRLNTADNLKICATNSFSMTELTSIPADAVWSYDSSDGDPDSTAIGNWVDTSASVYTGRVYLLGRFNGINYAVVKKMSFISVDETHYSMLVANLDGSAEHTYDIPKDVNQDYVFFDVINGLVLTQPARSDWDMVFTSYSTTLYTDLGEPTPYNVRGIFINESQVTAALDSVYTFDEIDFTYIDSLDFSSRRDVIGHDWKYYNGEDYVVRPGINFILKDDEGYYYKFRFINYHNSMDEAGYPGFEMQRL